MEKRKECCENAGNGCCEPGQYMEKKKLLVEYLYLDLKSCERCMGTDEVLEQVLAVLRPALELAGYETDYRKIEMATPELAVQYRFESSPTIRVNGRDIFGTVIESGCSCCGKIAGGDVDCRVFEHNGRLYEIPTKAMLTDAIIGAIHSTPQPEAPNYTLPENLKRFYRGKRKQQEETP